MPSKITIDISNDIDFSVFENIEVDDGKAMDRIAAILDYHQFVINNELNEKYDGDLKKAFISFCREIYTKKSMLDDYIEFTEHYADTKSLEEIKNRLKFHCENANKCGSTGRHYRDRRQDSHKEEDDDVDTKWFIDRVDSIHFMVHHMVQLGMRVNMESLESEMKRDDDDEKAGDSKDHRLKRMKQEISSKRKEFSNDRLDDTANTKFTMKVDELTATDGMLLLSVLAFNLFL